LHLEIPKEEEQAPSLILFPKLGANPKREILRALSVDLVSLKNTLLPLLSPQGFVLYSRERLRALGFVLERAKNTSSPSSPSLSLVLI
jgi:hypothetical protein